MEASFGWFLTVAAATATAWIVAAARALEALA
jgi:hypothetical protein